MIRIRLNESKCQVIQINRLYLPEVIAIRNCPLVPESASAHVKFSMLVNTAVSSEMVTQFTVGENVGGLSFSSRNITVTLTLADLGETKSPSVAVTVSRYDVTVS